MKWNKPNIDTKAAAASFKASLQTITTRNGAYSAAAIVIVVVIAVVINLICGSLPATIKQLDISSNKIYEISDTSRKLLKSLEYDVDITVIAEEESMDDRLRTFLEKYTALSGRLTLETVDPVMHPSALSDYGAESDTIIVSCQETGLSAQIPISDILIESISYYYTGTSSLSAFDGDGQLTAAINQVIGSEKKTVYCLSGHGESDLSDTATGLLTKAGISTDSCSLLMDNEIPEDCDLLLVNGLASDMTEDEAALLDDYIKSGGNVLILLSEKSPTTGNAADLLAEYGIHLEDGYVADMERNYQGNYYYIFPNITAPGSLADGLNTQMVLMSNARGFTLDDSSEQLAIFSLLDTSSYGYMVTEDSQEQGVYSVAARVEYTPETADDESDEGGSVDDESDSSDDSADSVDDEDDSADDTAGSANDAGDADSSEADSVTGTLTVYGSASIIDEGLTSAFSGLDNNTLFMNSLTAAIGDMDNLSIEAKSLEIQYNTPQYGSLFSVLIIFVVPLAVVVFGLVYWLKRRKA